MADRPGIARRLVLAGLLAGIQGEARAQPAPATPLRGPTAVPTLLRNRGQQVLRAGIDLDGTATAFRDPFGIPDGVAVRIGQLLADGLDVDLALVETDSLHCVKDLRQGRFDVLLNAPPLMIEVARELLYADPYAHMDLAVVARVDTPLHSVAGLRGQRLGIQAGPTERLAPSRLPPNIPVTIRPLANAEAMVTALRLGVVEALAVTSATADRLVAPRREMEIKFILGDLWVGPACRFGEHDLLRAVNTIFHVARQEGLLQGLHQEFYNRPLPQPPFF